MIARRNKFGKFVEIETRLSPPLQIDGTTHSSVDDDSMLDPFGIVDAIESEKLRYEMPVHEARGHRA